MPLNTCDKGAKTDAMCFENKFKLLLEFIPYSHLPQQGRRCFNFVMH